MLWNRSDRLSWRLLLVALPLAGCSSTPPEEAEPTPREVRKELARNLKAREEHILLNELHEEGNGKYSGRAEGAGLVYTVEAKTEGRWLDYKAVGRAPLGGDVLIVHGNIPLPVPPFRESHAELMQWLRAVACVIQGLAVVWAVLGRFGYRRPYSPRVEKVLVVSAAINLGFALLWGYEFYTNLGDG